MQHDTEHAPILPPDHAFVVHLYSDTQIETGCVSGRVEHLTSRHAMSFQSIESLLSFMARVLLEVRHT